jgi:hypothetical protein
MTTEEMTVDELNDRVGKIIDALSNDLADEWLEDLEEQGEEEFSRSSFWEAARIIVRELEVRAYRERKAREGSKP